MKVDPSSGRLASCGAPASARLQRRRTQGNPARKLMDSDLVAKVAKPMSFSNMYDDSHADHVPELHIRIRGVVDQRAQIEDSGVIEVLIAAPERDLIYPLKVWT